MLTTTDRVQGPIQARIRWEPDYEPYDPGDTDHCDDHAAFTRGCPPCEKFSRMVWDYVEQYGTYGCIVETRAPAMIHPDAPAPRWEHAASLWSIVGDDEYHREVEAEMLAEVSA